MRIFPINLLCDDILIELFKHLNLEDRKAVSLVCQRWLNLVSIHTLAIEYPFVIRITNDMLSLFVLRDSNREFPFITIDISDESIGILCGFMDVFFWTNISKNMEKI